MDFDKTKATRILLDLHEFLNLYDIEHALICGTALGSYRDDTFLSEDIDIVCDAKDYWKVRSIVSDSPEWNVNCIWRREIALWRHNRKIDILFADFGEENTSIYIYKKNAITGKYHTEQRYVWKTKHILPYTSIEFLGTQFNVPANCPEFFNAYYGQSWQIPNPNWNRDNSPPPNLDLNYRQIDIMIEDVFTESIISCKQTYDRDWVRVIETNVDSNFVSDAPLLVRIFGNYKFKKQNNLNIFNEILLSNPCIDKVQSCIYTNLKSPESRSLKLGYKFHHVNSEKQTILIYMIRNNDDFLDTVVETQEFFQ